MIFETISVAEAFEAAPPRSPMVLCFRERDRKTCMQATGWFSWLNMKHQPMLSLSMPRDAACSDALAEDCEFYLANVPVADLKKYEKAVRKAAEEGSTLPVAVPENTDILLSCTLAGAYNFPFKKVRIFNCNLESASRLKAEERTEE